MSRKNVLPRYTIFNNASLESDLISPTTNIEFLDNIAIGLKWTTSDAIGTFYVEISMDGENWVPVEGVSIAVAGSTDHALLELVFMAAPLIRVTYDRTSGTGSVLGYISAKMI